MSHAETIPVEVTAVEQVTPLIKQFATISGIDTISATSAQGSTSIAVQVNLNRDIDSAIVELDRT